VHVKLDSLPPTRCVELYSAFTDKVERKCHFPASGWNCMKKEVDFIVLLSDT
jgi:hypothetical protein